MTREEEIEKVLDDKFDTDLYDYKTDNSYCNYCAGFRQGVEWADKHPISTWISVKDDLPCNHKELLYDNGLITKKVFVLINATTPNISPMVKFSEWDWAITNVTHWFAIPELLKE